MNVEPPDFARSLPPGVRPGRDAGTYTVGSRSRAGLRHTVVLPLLQCNCETATKGSARKAAKQNGGCPPFDAMCPHLKKVLCYFAVAALAALGREDSGEVEATAEAWRRSQ